MNSAVTKSRMLLGLVLAIGTAYLVVSFVSRDLGGKSTGNPDGKSLPSGDRKSGSRDGDEARKARERQEARDLRDWQSEFYRSKITVKDLDKYLDSTGRTSSALAFSLIVHWRDEIAEELRQRPSDPIACLALASKATEIERSKWADQLIRIEPQNAMGYLMKAAALADSGRNSASGESLLQGVGMHELQIHRDEVNAHFEGIKSVVGEETANLEYLKKAGVWENQTLKPVLMSNMFALNNKDYSSLAGFEKIMQACERLDSDDGLSIDIPLVIGGKKLFRELGADPKLKTSQEFKTLSQKIATLEKEAMASSMARLSFLRSMDGKKNGELDDFAATFRQTGWPDTKTLEEMVGK